MKIQEVMNKYPVTVGKDAPISDVADLLVKYNLTAVSVVDDDNKLLGIISEGDLLYKKVRPHVPHYVNVLGASIYYNGIGYVGSGQQDVEEAPETPEPLQTQDTEKPRQAS